MPDPPRVNATLFANGVVPVTIGLTPKQEEMVHAVGTTLRAYIAAAEALSNSKYAEIRHRIPAYLSQSRRVLAALCADGLIVRYGDSGETSDTPPGVVAGYSQDSITALAPVLSQGVAYCYRDRESRDSSDAPGMKVELARQSADGQQRQVLSAFDVSIRVVLEQPQQMPTAPQKPYCILSVRNTIEIHVYAQLFSTQDQGSERNFVARTSVRLPVAWDCVEVYPFFHADDWRPEYAPIWAENDILGAVVSSQFADAQFDTLDPNAAARRKLAGILQEYRQLLDSNPEREEILQVFLKEHPALLCPTHQRLWPKLAFGPYKTDFVFREAAGGYLLVELERSTHRLFIADGHISSELNHARGQITDWKRYLEDNLPTVQRELGLTGISSNPPSLVVIGRSDSLTPENRRKLMTMENDSPKIKVVTYDDVYENARAVIENVLGPIIDETENTRIYNLP
ncbi:MAG: DUF4263 domain-containing protein [Acidobacteria bacterium]|nr:DUF4263 domain-containing protein [Acidobacteriota bacterium]